jgi:hypothetical protein
VLAARVGVVDVAERGEHAAHFCYGGTAGTAAQGLHGQGCPRRIAGHISAVQGDP